MAGPATKRRGKQVKRIKRKQPRRPRRRTVVRSNNRKLTTAGLAFLKCAFAPPDFNADPGEGIPDAYEGKTFTDKNVISQAVGGATGKDDYYLFAPTPGVAYWSTQTTTGTAPVATSTWTPTYYPGCFGAGNLFGPVTGGETNRADNVDSFRYASLAVGVYLTSPELTTAGSIQVWKTPLTFTEEQYVQTIATTTPTKIEAVAKVVNGIEGASVVPRDNYSQHAKHGAYTVSTNNQPDFPFRPITEGIVALPPTNYTSGMFGKLNGPVLGLGTLDAVVVKISNAANNSFILKSWSCIEYRTTASSLMDRLCRKSPPLDPLALEMYRHASSNVPLAVVSADNANFWNNLLRILAGTARAASFVPGPIGMIGAGASSVISGMRELFI